MYITLPYCIPGHGTLSVKGAEQTMTFPQPEQLLTKRCPLCASTTTTPFLRRSGVPVLTNLLIASQEAARQVQRGDIVLLVCHTCGFVFNGAFGTSTLYNEHYENSQAHAPAFESYLDEL